MGGYVALAFLQKYPNAVDGLILSDTQTIADTSEAKDKREATARDVLEHGTANLINDVMTKALSANATTETKAYLRSIIESQSAAAIASGLRGMAIRAETSQVLAATNVPVLIIVGDNDTLISPMQSSNMHMLAKNSVLVIIQNAGHLSSLEQPALWNQAVKKTFL
jgi:pimeloyl-ACP methyl ester carboxylesterase